MVADVTANETIGVPWPLLGVAMLELLSMSTPGRGLGTPRKRFAGYCVRIAAAARTCSGGAPSR